MGISATDERVYEKRLIENKKDIYLNNNVLDKYINDKGYKEKVDIIKNYLERCNVKQYILDIGSNTSGESEILFHLGYKMIPTDINEIALSISKKRSKYFRNEELVYFASDAHNIPVADNTFEFIIAFEVLHHMENVNDVVSELYRVLLPGGHLFTFDPYAFNPYRKIAEFRDYFKGTIEKSFSIRKLKNILKVNGFEIININKRRCDRV